MVNPKTTDDNVNVIQLETAVGAAMKCFNGALGEPRMFTPNWSPLLARKSRLFVITN